MRDSNLQRKFILVCCTEKLIYTREGNQIKRLSLNHIVSFQGFALAYFWGEVSDLLRLWESLLPASAPHSILFRGKRLLFLRYYNQNCSWALVPAQNILLHRPTPLLSRENFAALESLISYVPPYRGVQAPQLGTITLGLFEVSEKREASCKTSKTLAAFLYSHANFSPLIWSAQALQSNLPQATLDFKRAYATQLALGIPLNPPTVVGGNVKKLNPDAFYLGRFTYAPTSLDFLPWPKGGVFEAVILGSEIIESGPWGLGVQEINLTYNFPCLFRPTQYFKLLDQLLSEKKIDTFLHKLLPNALCGIFLSGPSTFRSFKLRDSERAAQIRKDLLRLDKKFYQAAKRKIIDKGPLNLWGGLLIVSRARKNLLRLTFDLQELGIQPLNLNVDSVSFESSAARLAAAKSYLSGHKNQISLKLTSPASTRVFSTIVEYPLTGWFAEGPPFWSAFDITVTPGVLKNSLCFNPPKHLEFPFFVFLARLSFPQPKNLFLVLVLHSNTEYYQNLNPNKLINLTLEQLKNI